MAVVEKTRDFFSRLPSWWPVLVGIVWLIWSTATWHADVTSQLKTQEDQIQDIQQYLRHDHDKSAADPFNPGISSVQKPQETAAP